MIYSVYEISLDLSLIKKRHLCSPQSPQILNLTCDKKSSGRFAQRQIGEALVEIRDYSQSVWRLFFDLSNSNGNYQIQIL